MSSLQPHYQTPRSTKVSSVTLPTPAHWLAIIFLIPAFRYLYLDYRKYIALGPGGTPSTFSGYVRVKILGLFALSNPYEPPSVPLYTTRKEGRLSNLPKRRGPRPTTVGIAPHRQVDQRTPPALFEILSAAIRTIASRNNRVELGTSCFEKHGPGLFSINPLRRTCRGEICHAHPSDGSLHLTLHPADAKVMLEAGWGERHPLARGGWLERFVPGGFVMLYAPRIEEEIEVVLSIIQAAAWWVSGEDVIALDAIRRDSGINDTHVIDTEIVDLTKDCSNNLSIVGGGTRAVSVVY